MTQWLVETLFWTGLLVALVLFIRRPVTRWFGPRAAYALWALPAIRLILPPIELPAGLRPSGDPAAIPIPDAQAGFAMLVELPEEASAGPDPIALESSAGAGSLSAAPTQAITDAGSLIPIDATSALQIVLALWLAGAAVFLVLRFSAYFRLRGQLLAGAREVGQHGKVRLVETPGTSAPIAFGVIDKVIALPPGFMAQPDRLGRDLALAHELAHHEGRDLLVNICVQPLFAMHWFNPLGHYGWLALRRDQEAACDARVLAARPPEVRAAYAQLIAGFARAPHIALAAPMACPVLGEKSIIHRLRSLSMSDTPKSRLVAGRLIIGAAIIALPLTATISYAASDAPAAPLAPPPPPPPGVSDAPPAPPAPPAPFAEQSITAIDPDTLEAREETIVIIDDVDGEERSIQRERIRVVTRDGTVEDAEIEVILEEVETSLADAMRRVEEVDGIVEDAMQRADAARSGDGRTSVRMECSASTTEIATTIENADGTRTVLICQQRAIADALQSLRAARASIADNEALSPTMRRRMLRQFDRAIDEWEDATS